MFLYIYTYVQCLNPGKHIFSKNLLFSYGKNIRASSSQLFKNMHYIVIMYNHRMVQYHNFLLLPSSSLAPAGQHFPITVVSIWEAPFCSLCLHSELSQPTSEWDYAILVCLCLARFTERNIPHFESSQITSFNLFLWLNILPFYAHFLYPSMADGQWDCIHFLVILDSAAKNMETQTSPPTYWLHFLWMYFLWRLLALWGFVIYM